MKKIQIYENRWFREEYGGDKNEKGLSSIGSNSISNLCGLLPLTISVFNFIRLQAPMGYMSVNQANLLHLHNYSFLIEEFLENSSIRNEERCFLARDHDL